MTCSLCETLWLIGHKVALSFSQSNKVFLRKTIHDFGHKLWNFVSHFV